MESGKNRANTESMAKETTFLERVAAITRELNSPTSVKRADETLETLVNEYAAILGMREQAAARFGMTLRRRPCRLPRLRLWPSLRKHRSKMTSVARLRECSI